MAMARIPGWRSWLSFAEFLANQAAIQSGCWTKFPLGRRGFQASGNFRTNPRRTVAEDRASLSTYLVWPPAANTAAAVIAINVYSTMGNLFVYVETALDGEKIDSLVSSGRGKDLMERPVGKSWHDESSKIIAKRAVLICTIMTTWTTHYVANSSPVYTL